MESATESTTVVFSATGSCFAGMSVASHAITGKVASLAIANVTEDAFTLVAQMLAIYL